MMKENFIFFIAIILLINNNFMYNISCDVL